VLAVISTDLGALHALAVSSVRRRSLEHRSGIKTLNEDIRRHLTLQHSWWPSQGNQRPK
jgi:hypothetical protein